MAIKTKYVEPNAYMSKEMQRAFNSAIKKPTKARKAAPKKRKAK